MRAMERSKLTAGSRCSSTVDAAARGDSIHPDTGMLRRDDDGEKSVMATFAQKRHAGRKWGGKHAVLCLRALVMEFAGTYVANLLALGVFTSGYVANNAAQMSTLLDTALPPAVGPNGTEVAPAPAMPPGVANPLLGAGMIPDPATLPGCTGACEEMEIPPVCATGACGPGVPYPPGGRLARVRNHNYVVFPNDQLMIGVGVATAFAMGLCVSPGTQLNPTFTVAVTFFDMVLAKTGKWRQAPFAIVGQMAGGVLSCWTAYGMGRLALRVYAPGLDVYNVVDIPKTVTTAQLYGVVVPNELLPNEWVFFNSVMFVALMAICIVPVFAQEDISGEKLPAAAKPVLVAFVVVPFVIAGTPFGVQTNAALYISGLIFCSMAGWNSYDIWSAHDNVAWIVAVSPIIGAIIGSFFLCLWFFVLYDVRSPCVWRDPADDDEEEADDEAYEYNSHPQGANAPPQLNGTAKDAKAARPH